MCHYSGCFWLRPTGRLDEYLACIAKIQKAVEYFQDNNPDSPELNTVVQYYLLSSYSLKMCIELTINGLTVKLICRLMKIVVGCRPTNISRTTVHRKKQNHLTLNIKGCVAVNVLHVYHHFPENTQNVVCFLQKARFEKGKELLEAEFRSLLTRYSKPVPPILILDAISVDEELEVQEDIVLEHLPEAVLQDIICIAGWLVEYGRNQGTALYRWLYILLLCAAPSLPFLFSSSIFRVSQHSYREMRLFTPG